jgi:nucleotide-binding universal stress UspA family protein
MSIQTLTRLRSPSLLQWWEWAQVMGVAGLVALAILLMAGYVPHLAAVAVLLHVAADFSFQSSETALRKGESGRHLLAEQALPHAIAQAEGFGAELILLRVVEPIAPTDVLVVPKVAAMRAEERTKAWTQEYLERVAARVQEQSIPVQMVTIEGRPHTEIVQFAESNQVDLIVICTRGQWCIQIISS